MQLLTPVDLGPVTLPNRVVSTSHQTGLVHDNLPTPDLIAYHEARARGAEEICSRPPWKSCTNSFVPCSCSAPASCS